MECDPDVTRFVLQPHKDTFVILGSDGLWDVFSDYDAVGVAATALKVSELELSGSQGVTCLAGSNDFCVCGRGAFIATPCH